MKRRARCLIVLGLVALFAVGCASMGTDVAKPQVTLVVTTPIVELTPQAKVVMYGTGLAPKREATLVFRDAGGELSGISGSVTPPPVTNQDGAWAAVWNLEPYVKMMKPGTGMISVVDDEFRTLAHAPVVFVAPPKKK